MRVLGVLGRGSTYKRVGRQVGPSRTGTVIGAGDGYIDVDISDYPGALLSGTEADAANFQTLCYVGGEYLAYTTAELIGVGQYRLSGLVRGAYSSTVAEHVAGDIFVRLDDALFKYPLSPAYVGKPLYIKAPSFNIYQAATQSLADVSPYILYPSGRPLLDAPAAVENFRIAINGSTASFTWKPGGPPGAGPSTTSSATPGPPTERDGRRPWFWPTTSRPVQAKPRP